MAFLQSTGGALLTIEVFEVDSKAKMIPMNIKGQQSLDSTKVLVYIDHDEKVIYLWRGKKADVVKKLVGTRVVARLSHTYPDYRIRPVAEGHEPAAFRAFLS